MLPFLMQPFLNSISLIHENDRFFYLNSEESVPMREGGHAMDTTGVSDSGIRVGTLGGQTVELSHCLVSVNRSVSLEPLHGLAKLIDFLIGQLADVLSYDDL